MTEQFQPRGRLWPLVLVDLTLDEYPSDDLDTFARGPWGPNQLGHKTQAITNFIRDHYPD